MPAVRAQTGRFFSTDKELSNSLINKVYQDRKGYVWIATEDGLNKFDGTRFFIYKYAKNDSTSLKNNYVRTLYEDKNGCFWIGCINGLQLYDRATDGFREVDVYRNGVKVHPHITGIVERANGEIWMSTSGQGVLSVRMDENGNPVIKPETSYADAMNSIYLNAIFEDSQRNLWIATEDRGVFRFAPDGRDMKNFRATEGLEGDDVSAICEDRRGNIFMGSLTKGVFRLSNTINGYEEVFKAIPYGKGNRLNVKTLMLGRRGNLFIGTDGDGLKEYDADRNEIVDYAVSTAPFDFSKSKVHAILEDRDDNIWLGIFQKGLILVPGAINKFSYYGYKSIHKNTIGSGCVMAVWKDKQGVTWVGTDNDGLYAINDDGEQLAHHKPGRNTSVPGTVMAIYEDSRGELWLGSYFNGLARMDRRTGTCRYVDAFPARENKAGSEKVSCIMEDNKQNLWVGTYGAGVQKINLTTGNITYHESTREESNDWSIDRLPNDWINCILKGRDGLMWIGTYNGLACYDPERNTFINHLNRSNLLPGYVVYSLLETADGKIWIGTMEGLVAFDRQTEAFDYYTAADGLPSDVICGMVEDEWGHIWISTHQGVSKRTVSDGRFVNYYAADGLQGNEFSRGAAFRDARGKIFFGGTNGITAFFPKEVLEQKKDLKVLITDFYLINRSVKKGDTSGGNVVTDVAVMDANSFTFAYNENTFSMEFSAFEFNNPERITYQYKIEELSGEWINTHSGVNRVTFTNLNPGRYTFRVRAADHDNFSNTRTVHIHITPPWYHTTWALLLWVLLGCMVLCALVMYILSRVQHKQELLEREYQEQISEAKLQFFINISHEIRTPMTLIISPLEKLLAEADADRQPTYLRIYRNAQRILRLINQLMDIRKLDKGQMHLKFRETDMVGFIDDLMQTFEYQAEEKKINFRFVHTDPQLKVWVDLNNFDKVLMNVLSNAFKYTPREGEICVSLRTGTDPGVRTALRHYFQIDIEDTGIGIDKDRIEQIFERFYQINNDVTNSNFGTGIGLHLSRSLVKLHHGIIRAENREGGGTRFIIRLPMGSDHLQTSELENPETLPTDPDYLPEKKRMPDVDVRMPDETNELKKKSRTRHRVLVVEDDDEIRRYIREEMNEDFRVSECTNGREALDYILRETPDLVISDVMMPEMDGMTLSRKMKQNININHIPIVLLTAKSKAEDRIEGLETGADAYIVKPFNAEVLRTTVSNLIANRERLKSKFAGEQQVEKNLVKIEKKSGDDILMAKIMKTINDHLSDSALSVNMLADAVGLSRVHIHRKLKELTGQSARDFIRGIRLKQAATLLSEGRLTVSEVAYETGFSNLSHFSVSFKEFYGMSPTEYRESVG